MKINMLEALMRYLPMPVYFKSLDGKFVIVSHQMALNFGTTPDKMMGKTYFDFLSEKEAKKAWENDKRVIMTEKPVINERKKRVLAEDLETYSLVTRAPWYDNIGKLVGVMVIEIDITKLVEYEEEMRNLYLNESHDIKNPLIAARGLLDRIIREKYGPINDSAMEKLRHIHVNLSNVELKVKGLLNEVALLGFDEDKDLRQMSFGKQVDVQKDIIESILYAHSNQIKEQSISIVNKLESRDVLVRANLSWLSSVFENNISNAIKYGGRGCTIELDCLMENSRVTFTISNTGSLLEEEFVRSKLFRKFQRENDSAEGSGIGLYVSRKIMRMMGGDIGYRSNAELHPEFYFWLPL